jgi:hypothetical protein
MPNAAASNDPSAVPAVTVPAALLSRALGTLESLAGAMQALASEGPDALEHIYDAPRIARTAVNGTTRELIAELRAALSSK